MLLIQNNGVWEPFLEALPQLINFLIVRRCSITLLVLTNICVKSFLLKTLVELARRAICSKQFYIHRA